MEEVDPYYTEYPSKYPPILVISSQFYYLGTNLRVPWARHFFNFPLLFALTTLSLPPPHKITFPTKFLLIITFLDLVIIRSYLCRSKNIITCKMSSPRRMEDGFEMVATVSILILLRVSGNVVFFFLVSIFISALNALPL